MPGRFGKRLIYFLVIAMGFMFLAGLLQTSFLPFIGLFGAVPDLILILTCGAAFYLGPVDGAAVGLVGGITVEAFGGYGLALAPLFYLLAGAAFGWLSLKMFRGRFWHYLVYVGLFCTAKGIYSAARIGFSYNNGHFGAALWHSVLPEWLGTLLLALVLAVPVRLFAGLLRGRMSMRKGRGGLGDI